MSMVHDRFVNRRDNPLVGKSVFARACIFACVRVCVKVINVCHDASPLAWLCVHENIRMQTGLLNK